MWWTPERCRNFLAESKRFIHSGADARAFAFGAVQSILNDKTTTAETKVAEAKNMIAAFHEFTKKGAADQTPPPAA